MYKEIHPFWFDSSAFATNRTQQSKEYYKPCEPRIIRLEDIRQIVKESVPDGSIKLRRLCISDDYHSDIIISEKEAAEIQALLLNPNEEDSLVKEIKVLSNVLRNLCEVNLTKSAASQQKSAKWNYPYGENETVDKLIAIAECLEMDGDSVFNGYTGTECGKFLRELARKQVKHEPEEWSEEDERMLRMALECLDYISCQSKVPVVNWLKSLPGKAKACSPQPHLKPSEEQMEVELNEETLREEFHTIDRQCFDEGIEGWQREKLIARHFYYLKENSKKQLP